MEFLFGVVFIALILFILSKIKSTPQSTGTPITIKMSTEYNPKYKKHEESIMKLKRINILTKTARKKFNEYVAFDFEKPERF